MQINSLYAGTAGGTIFSVIPLMNGDDLLQTVVLAAVGAVVSFGVSLLLKYLCRKRDRSTPDR